VPGRRRRGDRAARQIRPALRQMRAVGKPLLLVVDVEDVAVGVLEPCGPEIAGRMDVAVPVREYRLDGNTCASRARANTGCS